MRISKTVSNTNAQHASGQWSTTSGHNRYRAAKLQKYTGGDTTRFLCVWLVDSSRGNTVARVLLGRGKIAEHWPTRGYKKVRDHHCFSVYLSNTCCRYKRLFVTPIHSQLCVACEKWDLSFWTASNFQWINDRSNFKLWCFPERSYSSTNKHRHFLGLQKVTTFAWYPKIVTEKLGYLNEWRLFGALLFDCPPETPGLDPSRYDVCKFYLCCNFLSSFSDFSF